MATRMKLLAGALLLLGVLLIERNVTRKPPAFAHCDWWSLHPNGGGL